MSFVSKEFAAAIPESTNLVAFRNMEPKPLTFLASVFSALNNDKIEPGPTEAEIRKGNSCNLCSKSFLSSRKLEKHMLAHTRVEICTECGKSFSPGSLRFHKKTHERKTGENLCCKICSKMLSSQKFLELHMEAHANAKPKTCEVCGKVVKNHMKDHLKAHIAAKPHKCSLCDYACYKQVNLEKHIILHANNNKTSVLKCQTCRYLTADVTNMKKHTKVHLNEKTHNCDLCYYKSDTKGKIMIHMKRKHKEAN